MDQIKTGKFIASCRKEQGMTQAVLAEKLGISDRAVSKWETRKSMPDSGIMLEKYDLLHYIDVCYEEYNSMGMKGILLDLQSYMDALEETVQ